MYYNNYTVAYYTMLINCELAKATNYRIKYKMVINLKPLTLH